MKNVTRAFAVLLLTSPSLLWAQDDPWTANPGSIWGQSGDLPGCTLPIGLSDPNGAAPGRHCRQNCCAVHDKCYADNGCTYKSWVKTLLDQADLAPWLALPPSPQDWLLAAIGNQIFGPPPPSDADNGPACQQCNTNVGACWASSLVGNCINPGSCPADKESCYDRACPHGRAYYCGSDCYSPLQDICETEFGDVRCQESVNLGYGPGVWRTGFHGGALLNCVPFCYNLASANHLIDPGLSLCADGYPQNVDAYAEQDSTAQAGGFITSFLGGGVCCFCRGDGIFPWEDPRWHYERPPSHDGVEGGLGVKAGCPTGCPCTPPPLSCYDIGGCWNDGHMAAQAVCGEAVGMICG